VTDEPFAFIDLPAARSRTKPRRSGLTMMADFGMTLEHTESILGLSASYIDFAKIAVGTARLYTRPAPDRPFEPGRCVDAANPASWPG
jgi:phosphosulfolactate synthase (CoM biosynthesis protein A)